MKRVLFIEKTIEATTILPTLSSNNREFEIDSTASIDGSINFIKKNKYSLVYINIDFLDMSIIPVFEALLKQKYIGNIIFSGDYKNPRVIKKTDDFNTLDILIKPFDNSWLKKAISSHLTSGKSIGNESTTILSLYFIFKIIAIEKGTIAFKTNFDGKKGLLVFENGIVVHSKFDNKDDISALKEFIESNVPSNKREITITTPGFFVKKNSNINLSSILDTHDNSGNTTPKQNDPINSYSSLISFMLDKFRDFDNKDALKEIESTANEMGFSLISFPSNEEIDLIENVSRKLDDTSKSMDFKKVMINFLISNQKSG